MSIFILSSQRRFIFIFIHIYTNDYYRWRSYCSVCILNVCILQCMPPPPAGNDVKQIGAGRWLENDDDGGGDVDVYPPFLCTQQRLRLFLIWYDRLYRHACTTYYNIILNYILYLYHYQLKHSFKSSGEKIL